jgi:two-component system cell cycle sensor histidine kinase/response regulator CckA
MASGDDLEELVRLRAENEALKTALASECERFRAVFDSSPIAIGIFSFQEARFLEVNARFLEMLGLEREEFFARDPYELWVGMTHPDDVDTERKELAKVMEGLIDGYRMRKRHVKDGRQQWREVAAQVVRDERRRVRYAIFQSYDVHDEATATEVRHELEARLRQAQRLETVGRLVGGVAHDFNNRLLVIMGYAEMLRRAASGNAELESSAEVVLTSAKRAADLTRQLLAFGRRQMLKPCSTDLNGVVDRMRRMLERVIGERVELVTVLGAKYPMLADPGQIEQVLMNLVLNARDAMQDGGRVTIETADAAVTPGSIPDLSPGSYVTLSVSDTGPGVAEAVREQIFEPFFTTKESGKGTGLGLAMVDGLVRQSGGVVGVRSVEGKGATFTVYLLRANAAQRQETPLPGTLFATHRSNVETVLVVDDEDEVRKLLVDVLGFGAYRVLEARDGQHGLDVAEAHAGTIDLLVTDVVMPKMKGPELAEHLRQRHPALKTLFVSGYAERDTRSSLAESEHFLAKPFLPAELFRLVREILETHGGREVERAG